MKWFKLALASGTSLLAMTAHAQADFIFTPLTFVLFSSPLGAALGPAAIYTGLQVAAYAAVLGAQLILGQRQQPQIDPGELKNTFQEAETPEYNGVGRVRVAGLKAFGNTKEQTISRLVWHLRGPIDAIEEYFVGGRSVIVDPDGTVSSPPWATENNNYLTIESKIGDGTETAWSELIADFPSLWTSDHRCRGVFQSLARFRVPNLNSQAGNKRFQKLYQGGAPDVMVTARTALVYDPRDATQDANNENTWKWSDNGILCAVHIMRRYPDLTSSDFDWDFIADEADKADALVPTLTGTEPRSRCWGIWPSESKRGDTMQQVLDSIGAEVIVSSEGLIRIRLIDDDPLAEIEFTDHDVVDLDWKSGPDAVERPNVCRLNYYSPERGYDMGEINLSVIDWARIDDEVARYGKKEFELRLPFCPSPSQAQRIARRLFFQARADVGEARMNMVGMAAWGLTYATIRDDDADEDMLCRIAAPRSNDQEGKVGIPYIVWPQRLIDDPWNPATMEAPAPLPAPDLQYESELDTPSAPSQATVVEYPGGGFETRIKYGTVSGGTTSEANYRTYDAGLPEQWAGMTEYEGDDGNYYAWVGEDARSRADFRVRWFNNEGEGSYFSDPLEKDPLVIDNTATGEPNVTESMGGEGFVTALDVTVPELRAIKILVEKNVDGGGWTEVDTFTDIRPGIEYTADLNEAASMNSKTVQWRVSSFTSDNTQGAYATGSFVIPGAG